MNKVPSRVAKQLEIIRNKFLWGDSENKRTYYLVNWDEVKQSMTMGGLGIRFITSLNKIFHGKWIWRYFNDVNSLWRGIVDLKWMNFDSNGSLIFPKRSHGTSVWKGILSMFTEMMSNTCWKIGNGCRVNFQNDRWCSDDNRKSVFLAIYSIAQHKNLMVCDAFDNSGLCNVLVTRNLNDWKLDEYGQPLNLMDGIIILDRRDTLIWKGQKNGIFSIRSFYNILSNSSNRCNTVNSPFPFKSIWKTGTPPIIAFFAWEASKKKILPLDNLMKSGKVMVNRCFLCKCNAESSNHILLWCPFVSKL